MAQEAIDGLAAADTTTANVADLAGALIAIVRACDRTVHADVHHAFLRAPVARAWVAVVAILYAVAAFEGIDDRQDQLIHRNAPVTTSPVGSSAASEVRVAQQNIHTGYELTDRHSAVVIAVSDETDARRLCKQWHPMKEQACDYPGEEESSPTHRTPPDIDSDAGMGLIAAASGHELGTSVRIAARG